MMKHLINIVLLATLLLCFLPNLSLGQNGNGFHSYKIGIYKGEAFNTTSNGNGKAVLEIKTIDTATGRVTARFAASDGLYGDADLTGKIDESGAMKLSGTLSGLAMTVVARVNGSTIKANYRLTGGYAPQDGSFSVTNGNDDAENKTIDNKDAAAPKKTDASQTPSELKVGDRVMASPLYMETSWWKCTVTNVFVIGAPYKNAYGVRCDPREGYPFMTYRVDSDWIRPLKDGSVAPTFDCSFDTPAGTVSRTAGPSAQLFKRVLYEENAAVEKTKIGMVFTMFQMGAPFKNLLTRNGLMNGAAPQNAMIYTMKTQYRICKDFSPEYNSLTVIQEDFVCFKDRNGDWVCGPNSVPKFLEDQSVPKKH